MVIAVLFANVTKVHITRIPIDREDGFGDGLNWILSPWCPWGRGEGWGNECQRKESSHIGPYVTPFKLQFYRFNSEKS